jgi:surfactin synthase thioesterase subunit
MNPQSLLSRSRLHASPRQYDKSAVVFAAHAGGSASAFAPVRVRLLEHTDFIGVTYPGRRLGRVAQSPRSVDEMAAHVIAAIDVRALSDSLELTLWGYSLGALVVIEAARRLVQRGWPRVKHVVVAACRPPHLFSSWHLSAHAGEGEFLQTIRRLGGVPRSTLESPHWLAHAMPAIRADFLVCSQYRCDDAIPLPVPLTVLSGADDELAPFAEMGEWHRYSTIACNEYVFTGGHFFVHDHAAEVAAIIASAATPISQCFAA